MSNQQNPIRVYDNTITLVGELDNYANAYFTRSWYGAGSFSIQMNANMPHSEDLQKGYIVMFARDKYRCGIITQIVKKLDENGKGGEVITASGFELAYIFSWRIILPQAASANYTLSNSAESVMKQLVKDQCGSTADADRQFSTLDIATDQDRGSNYVMNIRYNSTVLDELGKVAKATGVGYFVYLDESNKKIIFEIGQGIDRTIGQSTNPRAIFSSDYDTLRQASISNSDNQYRNYAYVAGQGLGVDRTVREVYSTAAEPTGFERKELFIDARDLSATADIDARGGQKLEELNIQETIEGMPLTYSPLVYRTDYDIGDMVTIVVYGESVDKRITEIKESWAPLSYDIDAVFDKEPQTIGMQVNSAVESLRANFTQTEGYIIESGSNANGKYIKYSDGTLHCFLLATSVASNTATWTFPSSAVAGSTPRVYLTPNQNAMLSITGSTSIPSITSVVWALTRTDTGAYPTAAYKTALSMEGEWK